MWSLWGDHQKVVTFPCLQKVYCCTWNRMLGVLTFVKDKPHSTEWYSASNYILYILPDILGISSTTKNRRMARNHVANLARQTICKGHGAQCWQRQSEPTPHSCNDDRYVTRHGQSTELLGAARSCSELLSGEWPITGAQTGTGSVCIEYKQQGCVPPHIPFLCQNALRGCVQSAAWRASPHRYLSALLHI